MIRRVRAVALMCVVCVACGPVEPSSSTASDDMGSTTQPVDMSGTSPTDMGDTTQPIDMGGTTQPVDMGDTTQPLDMGETTSPFSEPAEPTAFTTQDFAFPEGYDRVQSIQISPDGSKLAMVMRNIDSMVYELLLTDMEVSHVEVVVSDTDFIQSYSDLRWLPSGERIMFTKGNRFFAVNPTVSATPKSVYKASSSIVHSFDISDDGTIVFETSNGVTDTMYKLTPTDETAVDYVETGLGSGDNPHISPDGQRLFYTNKSSENIVVDINDLSGEAIDLSSLNTAGNCANWINNDEILLEGSRALLWVNLTNMTSEVLVDGLFQPDLDMSKDGTKAVFADRKKITVISF